MRCESAGDHVEPTFIGNWVLNGNVGGQVHYRPDGTVLGASTDDMEIIDMLSDEFTDMAAAPVAPAPAPAPKTNDPPNRELIQAVLDGKTVQWKRPGNDRWDDFLNKGFAIQMLVGYGGVADVEFRIKPEGEGHHATVQTHENSTDWGGQG